MGALLGSWYVSFGIFLLRIPCEADDAILMSSLLCTLRMDVANEASVRSPTLGRKRFGVDELWEAWLRDAIEREATEILSPSLTGAWIWI